MGKLYGTRKHGVMAHNGEVGGGSGGGGAVWIDLDIPQVIYPTDDSGTYVTNFELLAQIIQQIDEAVSAGKMVYIRAQNKYSNEEIGMRSENNYTTFIYSLAQIGEYVEELRNSDTFLFCSCKPNNISTADGTISYFLSFDKTYNQINATNSGLWYVT